MSEPGETTVLLDLKADASYEATGYGESRFNLCTN